MRIYVRYVYASTLYFNVIFDELKSNQVRCVHHRCDDEPVILYRLMHARRLCIKNMKKFRPWVFGLYNSTKIKKKDLREGRIWGRCSRKNHSRRRTSEGIFSVFRSSNTLRGVRNIHYYVLYLYLPTTALSAYAVTRTTDRNNDYCLETRPIG